VWVTMDGQGVLNAGVRATAKQKTVGAGNVSIIAYDLAHIVDARRKRSKVGRRIVEGCVNAAATEKAVEIIATVGVVADDLARVIDAKCIGAEYRGRGIIESGVGTAVGIVEEAVLAVRVYVSSGDLVHTIDGVCKGPTVGRWVVEGGIGVDRH